MKLRYPVLIIGLLLIDITLVVWSCSDRSPADPRSITTPPANPVSSFNPESKPPILPTVIDNGKILAGTGSLGFYRIVADSRSLKGEITEIRKSMNLGDSHEVDITSFLTGSPCGDCFRISSVDYTPQEELVVGFTIRHPFDLPVQDPPSARERLDLHVFDLAGIIFLSDGRNTTYFPSLASHTAVGEEITTLSMDNSGFWASEDWDGYTGDFDGFVDGFYPTAATLHPYKILILDPSRGNVNPGSQNGFDDVMNPKGHNVFAQGKSYSANLKFRVPQGESVEFVIALTASYGESAHGKGNMPGQRRSPRYFLPEFNRKEAWRARMSIPLETDLLEAGNPDSSTILNVEIWDWQQNYGQPMNDIEPLSSPLDALHHSSRVASCVVDIPSVNNLDVASEPSGGDGFGDSPLVYKMVVNNDKIAAEGFYYGLVAIVDEMHGTLIENYSVERDGITAFDVADFVTYIPFTVSVINRGGEQFSMNKSLRSIGEDDLYYEILPDASDTRNMAANYTNVYSVYSGYSSQLNDGWDIYFKKSTDLGTTWNQAETINSATTGNQRQATIQVNKMTGDIYVAYVDESELLPGSKGSDIVIIRSHDGGATFSEPKIINNSREGSQDQPTMGIDSFGTIFIAWRSSIAGSPSAVNTAWMRDDMQTVTDIPFVQEAKTYYSSPVIAVRQTQLSMLSNYTYLAYKRSDYFAPDILCCRFISFNSGYGESVCVSNEKEGEAYSPNMDIDISGTVFITYIDKTTQPPSLRVARSFSDGKTWLHSPSLNSDINGTSPAHPSIIIRPNNNFIFLLWRDEVDGDKDIYIMRSTDGWTYSKPWKLNTDLTGSAQEFPCITSNQLGDLFALWRDKRIFNYGELYFTRGGVD